MKHAYLSLKAFILCLVSIPLYANTNVYFINRTPFPIKVATKTYFPKNTSEKPQWSAYGYDDNRGSKAIMPGQKEKIVSFARDEGVKNGETYQFKTYVDIPAFNDKDLKQDNKSTQLSLFQKIKGELIGSHMSQGQEGPDFERIQWRDDRTLRYNSFKRDREIFHLGYFAKATGSYDDVYYVLTWAFDYPEVKYSSNDHEFRVLFQNLWMRPSLIAIGCTEKRAKIIPDLFGGSRDALVFSEAFSSDAKILLKTFKEKYGYKYQTGVLGEKEAAKRTGTLEFLNGGIVMASKHPPVGKLSLSQTDKDLDVKLSDNKEYKYILYDTEACLKNHCPSIRYDTSCAGMDCRASKGVMYMPVKKNSMTYHLFATHTNASYTIPANAASTIARSYQIYVCKKFIEAQNIPPTDPVIFVGDLNIDMINPISAFPDNAKKEFYEIDGKDFRFKCPAKCENKLICPKAGGWCINEYDAMLKQLHATHPKITGYRGISEAEKSDRHYSFNPNINILATDGMGDQGYKFNLFLDYVLYSNDYLKPEESYNNMLMPMTKGLPYDCSGSLPWQGDLEYSTPISDHWAIDAYFKYHTVKPAPKIKELPFLEGLQFGNVTNSSSVTYTLPEGTVVSPGKTADAWKKQIFLNNYWNKKSKFWTLSIRSSDPAKSSSLTFITNPAGDPILFHMGTKPVGDLSKDYITKHFIQPQAGIRGLESARLFMDISKNDMRLTGIELYINRLEKKGQDYTKHRDYIYIGPDSANITQDWDKPYKKSGTFKDELGKTYKGLADPGLYSHK